MCVQDVDADEYYIALIPMIAGKRKEAVSNEGN